MARLVLVRCSSGCWRWLRVRLLGRCVVRVALAASLFDVDDSDDDCGNPGDQGEVEGPVWEVVCVDGCEDEGDCVGPGKCGFH